MALRIPRSSDCAGAAACRSSSRDSSDERRGKNIDHAPAPLLAGLLGLAGIASRPSRTFEAPRLLSAAPCALAFRRSSREAARPRECRSPWAAFLRRKPNVRCGQIGNGPASAPRDPPARRRDSNPISLKSTSWKPMAGCCPRRWYRSAHSRRRRRKPADRRRGVRSRGPRH